MTENEMVGQHHRLNGLELEQAPGDGEGQRSLVCCSPWGHKKLYMTQQLNNEQHRDVTGWGSIQGFTIPMDMFLQVYLAAKQQEKVTFFSHQENFMNKMKPFLSGSPF